jgi:hypothetical protein
LDRAGHPSQVKLARFLAHVDGIAGPVLARVSGRGAAELIVGFSDGVCLIDGGHRTGGNVPLRSTRQRLRGPAPQAVWAMGTSAGLFPWLGKSVLIGEGDRLGAVACVNLGEQVVDVTLDGALADDEVFGDLTVRHAGGDQ